MANELESLLVRLEADTASLRRELKNAEAGVSNYEQKAGRSLQRADANFQKHAAAVQSQMRSVAAAVAGAFGAQAAGRAISDAGRLETLADAAGMTAQRYQQLRGAASLAGVQMSEFDNVIGGLAEKIGDARRKSGDLYEFLKVSLPTVAQQIAASKSSGEALAILSDTAQRLTRAEERAIFVKKAFSGASADLAKFLTQGSQAMAGAADEAQRLGLVLDSTALKAAQRTQQEYDRLTTQLDSRFKSALVGLMPVVSAFTNEMSKMFDVSKEDNALRIAGAPEIYSMKQLEDAAAALRKELKGVQEVAAVGTAGDTFEHWNNWLGMTRREADGLATALAAVNAEMAAREAFGLNSGPGRLGQFGAGLKGASGAGAGAWQTTTTPANGLTLRQKPDYTGADAMRQLEQQRLTVVKDTAQLIAFEHDTELEKFRRMLDDKTISESQFNVAREKLGTMRLVRIQQEVEAEQKLLAERLAPIASVIEQSLGQPLADAFNGGMKSMKDYFTSFAQQMALAVQQALILKPIMEGITKMATGGGTGNFLSSLFTSVIGARAGGGPVIPGRPYMVGENGPELMVPNLGGQVVSNAALMRAGAPSGGGGNVINIDARQADAGVVPRIMDAMRAVEAARPAPTTAVAAAAHRYPTRRGR